MRTGSVTVLTQTNRKAGSSYYWECLCDCGRMFQSPSSVLRRGIKSCGCETNKRLRLLRTKHGLTNTRIYHCYRAMRSRCLSSRDAAFKNYGGRGITVCERWLGSVEAFRKDMGDPPDGMSLDRIDVNGNYEPSNCRWATASEQAENQRRTRKIEWMGKSQSPAAWDSEIGFPKGTISRRLASGFSVERALDKSTYIPKKRHGKAKKRSVSTAPSGTSRANAERSCCRCGCHAVPPTFGGAGIVLATLPNDFGHSEGGWESVLRRFWSRN
jgi:hypothetical protein